MSLLMNRRDNKQILLSLFRFATIPLRRKNKYQTLPLLKIRKTRPILVSKYNFAHFLD